MNHPQPPNDDSLESDAVWKLLDQAAPARPRANFADDVVRMAKLLPAEQPWWKKLLSPAPIAGLAAVTAAIALAFTFLGDRGSQAPLTVEPVPSAPADPFAEIQDFAETETLIAAADHLDDFSDQELVGLIGF